MRVTHHMVLHDTYIPPSACSRFMVWGCCRAIVSLNRRTIHSTAALSCQPPPYPAQSTTQKPDRTLSSVFRKSRKTPHARKVCLVPSRYKATWRSGIQTPMAQGRSTTIISMIQGTRTSRVSIKISRSARIVFLRPSAACLTNA